MTPLVTNRYTPTAIVDIVREVWIGATRFHGTPSTIKGFFLGQSVRFVEITNALSAHAPAGARSPTEQVAADDSQDVAAIAAAKPLDVGSLFAYWPKRNQHAESLACNVFGSIGEFDKCGARDMILHVVSPFATIGQSQGRVQPSPGTLHWCYRSIIAQMVEVG